MPRETSLLPTLIIIASRCLIPAGTFLRKWGSQGSEDGQFFSPGGVAVDASGNVFVADINNYRIQVFSSSGAFLSKWGSYGIEDGQFNSPRGVAVDAAETSFVTDSVNHRIQVFDSIGTFLRKWDSQGSADGNSTVQIKSR